jgi:hypothetical protein
LVTEKCSDALDIVRWHGLLLEFAFERIDKRLIVQLFTNLPELGVDTVGRTYVPPYSPRASASPASAASGMARECAHGVSEERSDSDGLSERALTASLTNGVSQMARWTRPTAKG